jgi:hypothetical protein
MRSALVLIAAASLPFGCSTYHRGLPEPERAARPPDAPRESVVVAPSQPAVIESGSGVARDPVVASYEGREIRASELGAWFLTTHRREALASLSKLIGLEIVEREAARLGLSCPETFLAERRQALLKKLEGDAAVAYGIGTRVDRYLELRFQQSLESHLAMRLEEDRQRWLFSRIIRFDSLRTDQVELAMIVTRDRETAEEVASKLDQGADFGRLAARYSIHESAPQGGRLAPVPREALNPEVARRAFALTEGECTGILEVDDGRGSRQFELLRLVRHRPGRAVTWAEVEDEIEKGLSERPVDAMEWTAWYLRLERLYKVRVSANL